MRIYFQVKPFFQNLRFLLVEILNLPFAIFLVLHISYIVEEGLSRGRTTNMYGKRVNGILDTINMGFAKI